MVVHLAVWDPLPVYRAGVATVLRDVGVEAESPRDLRQWLSGGALKVVLLTLVEAEAWTILEEVRGRSDVWVVAVLEDTGVGESVRAFRAGAAGVLGRDASRSALRECVAAAARGVSHVPGDVLRALASPAVDDPQPAEGASDSDRAWLRLLAQGATVNELADSAGFSERMMFRKLRDLYARMGAANRTAALLTARNQGWL